MSYFISSRYLRYETNKDNKYADYGQVSQIINDKMINIDMGGSGYILEAVGVEGDYVPQMGDWVSVSWNGGNPVAKGAPINSGLRNINDGVKIISTTDLAGGVVNSEHIRANTIEARHISAQSIWAEHISANQINAQHISANSIQSQHISANQINSEHISSNTIQARHIQADQINATHISANAVQAEHISANSISSAQIVAGAIQAGHISANSINAGHISANSIQTNHISANSITSQKIQAGAINAGHISANSIGANLITANAIRSGHISANSIQSNHISANSITASHIQAGAITAVSISANSITGVHISANTISGNHITSDAIQGRHIGVEEIDASHITANSIDSHHIQADAINANHLSANSVQSEHISANSISANHITTDSINSRHISANSITGQEISANSISANHISADQINATHLSANSVTAETISANSVQTNHVSSNTIEARHIKVDSVNADHISANSVQSEHISANSISANHISADQVNANHISANSVQTEHISANTVDATHIKADAVQAQHISSNSIWGEHISANNISANHITANAINTGHLTANAVTADKIGADQINANHISANSVQSEHVSANTIETKHIKSDAITSDLISANSIDTKHMIANSINSALISANSILASHITANAIRTEHISANSINGNHISANQIQAQHIATDSIQARHISANSIGASEISANAVQAQHISANSINSTHVSANTINAGHITANAITTQHISANSITGQKINANQISANHITANAINATHVTANAIQAQHISANSVQAQHISANSVNAGHISANSIQTNHISANTITGDKIKANEISGNHIKAGSIDTDHLTVGSRKEGLLGQYFVYSGNGSNKFQVFKGHQIDPTINFSWSTGSPSIVGQNDSFSVRWQGFIYAPETGTYTFHYTADDLGKVVINNTTVVNIPSYTGVETNGTISLTAGQWYPILVEMTEGSGGATAILKWTKPSLTKEVIPSKYFTQGNTVIDGQTITTGSITASQIKTGTITADSGIIADLAITTAHIQQGAITSANIGFAEIKDVHIATGNIKNIHIERATIDYTKINSVDAGTITVGRLDGTIISGNTITGDKIVGGAISGFHISANSIDALHIKTGAITTTELGAHVVTSDKIQAGAITSDAIRVGSITAEHISTVGLDARIMQVYGTNGETLIGDGFLRVDGLDVGVIQSDNLLQNGLFLASSSDYGYKRDNPSGEALLGNTNTGIGAHQVWKIDLSTGAKVKAIDIPAKKPFDIAVHPSGNFAYITVQGDDSLVQLDLVNDVLTADTLNMGMGPARIKFTGMALMDMKHLFVLNSDPMDMNVPDSLIIVDSPPTSVNGDLYRHHEVALGNGPYDFVVDSNMLTYVTMKDQGDIVVLDTSHHDSSLWKVKGRIPISAYGTDNEHGGLPSTFGLNEVTGGDASGQYNDGMMGDMAGMSNMSHSHGGYGSSDGSLKTYEPHGIIHSSDPDHLYVVDYKNGELVVVDKKAQAPYNALIGTSPQGSFNGSQTMTMGDGMVMDGETMVGPSTSPASLTNMVDGGGPGTYYVRYRINIGDAPDFIEMVNGKLFITLEGSNDIAIIDEQDILDEINADRTYYGKFVEGGVFENWNVFEPMRTVNTIPVRYMNNIGSKPTFMQKLGNSLYVTLSGQNQIKEINTLTEAVTRTINTGTNPKGFAFTPDNRYMYVANYGGSGELSFIYPQGSYIGDPYMGLEGGIDYQGADGWTPDRSNWILDASGNIRTKSTVEFHINEPLLNEGGYAKLTAYGWDYQYAQIEQDITNVTNYSNGNNLINTVGERLVTLGTGNTIFRPKAGEWLNSPAPSNIKIGQLVSGNEILTNASANTYTIYYGDDCRIEFSANAVPSGGWVEADYTARLNKYFKFHNSSMLVAIENGSSPNFQVNYEIDEFVPKFVAVDNQQTSPFTPTADGINEQYEGLEYSVITNRAKGVTVTSSVAPTTGTLAKIVDDFEPDSIHGNVLSNPLPATSGTTTLPSGNQWVKLDLGKVYMIGKVTVSHSWGLDRIYKGTKTEVSEDGVNWTTVYDSAVSGTYNEKPSYHAPHNHTHYSKAITFGARPVRYVRDWANGWVSGDGLTSGTTNDWTEIKVWGDWELEKGYTYPSNSPKAGQQIATNGKGFISTDIPKAYVAMNIQIEFTSWWYMTYIVGPQFGKIKIEMPTLMNSGHYLTQEAPFINNVAHRHIMSFPPSYNVKEDTMQGIVSGKHRVIIRQESGKVTLDRLRFEDFQYYNRNPLFIPTTTSATIFTRYRLLAEQAKWYQGMGKQSTEGAYDTPRVNSDTGLPDKSVPIKYRVRLRAELNADGTKEERGTVYVTSAIFETGKQHTHWRRSEAVDIFPTARLQRWNPSQPHSTGISHDHLQNGSVRGAKIMANTIMDYHISNYARISEHKLDLNHPTHAHGRYNVLVGQGPMGTDLYMWEDNLELLNTIEDWAGSGGNFGTANTIARGDHKHDYLPLGGGQLTNTLNAKSINTSGNVSVTGNIVVTGTVDNVDIATFKGSFDTVSANVTNHIGSGGNAHAVAVSGGANGFIDGNNYGKLLRIQDNAINQTTADGRYLNLTGGTISNTLNTKNIYTSGNITVTGNIVITGTVDSVDVGNLNSSFSTVSANVTNHIGSGGNVHAVVNATTNGFMSFQDFNKLATVATSANNYVHPTGDGNLHVPVTGTGNANKVLKAGATAGSLSWGSVAWTELTGVPTTFTPSTHSHALSDANTDGFMSSGNYVKLSNIQSNAINQTTADGRYLNLSGGVLTGTLNTLAINAGGNVSVTGNITVTGTVDNVDVSGFKSSFDTVSGNVTSHIGSGAGAHSVAVSGGANGFIDGNNYGKLLRIQDNAINQTTADNRYLQLTGGTLSGDLSLNANVKLGTNVIRAGGTGNTALVIGATSGGIFLRPNGESVTTGEFVVTASNVTFGGNTVWHSGNFNPASKSDTTHIHANASATGNGFMTSTDFSKLAGVEANANNYVHPSTHSLDIITETTSLKIMTDVERTKLAGIEASANNYIHPSTHSLSMITETTSLKIMTDAERTKLAGIATSANNYVHPTTAGSVHLPSGGATGNFVKWSSNGTGSWTNVTWTDVQSKPTTFAPSAHTHSANEITDLFSNIYNKTEVNNLVGAKGDVHTSANNILHLTNTFDNMGLAIKIQPSGTVADTTKLIQINKTDSTEVFSVNYKGDVTINGDLRVTGVQTYAGTTTVDGDYTINGQLVVGGNSSLGDASTDIATVKGTLKVDGNLQEIGKYKEVHRRPLFGIAGDLQFQTDSIVFEDIVDYYGLEQYALPTAQSGATRYYRLYLVYGDDITSTQATAGQKATVRILNNSSVSKDLDLGLTWGSANGRRDAFTEYFTDLPTGNGKLQAKLATAGNNLGIRWIELVAYDKF